MAYNTKFPLTNLDIVTLQLNEQRKKLNILVQNSWAFKLKSFLETKGFVIEIIDEGNHVIISKDGKMYNSKTGEDTFENELMDLLATMN